MTDTAGFPKSPKNIIEPPKWAFEHLRSFLALVAIWAIVAALLRSDALSHGMFSWAWWPALIVFFLVAAGLSIVYVLQSADLLMVGAHWIVNKLDRLERISNSALLWLTRLMALLVFIPLCGAGVTIILALFYPEVISIQPR